MDSNEARGTMRDAGLWCASVAAIVLCGTATFIAYYAPSPLVVNVAPPPLPSDFPYSTAPIHVGMAVVIDGKTYIVTAFRPGITATLDKPVLSAPIPKPHRKAVWKRGTYEDWYTVYPPTFSPAWGLDKNGLYVPICPKEAVLQESMKECTSWWVNATSAFSEAPNNPDYRCKSDSKPATVGQPYQPGVREKQ